MPESLFKAKLYSYMEVGNDNLFQNENCKVIGTLKCVYINIEKENRELAIDLGQRYVFVYQCVYTGYHQLTKIETVITVSSDEGVVADSKRIYTHPVPKINEPYIAIRFPKEKDKYTIQLSISSTDDKNLCITTRRFIHFKVEKPFKTMVEPYLPHKMLSFPLYLTVALNSRAIRITKLHKVRVLSELFSCEILPRQLDSLFLSNGQVMKFLVKATPYNPEVVHMNIGEFELTYGIDEVERIKLEARYLSISSGRLVLIRPQTIKANLISDVRLKFIPHFPSGMPLRLTIKESTSSALKILNIKNEVHQNQEFKLKVLGLQADERLLEGLEIWKGREDLVAYQNEVMIKVVVDQHRQDLSVTDMHRHIQEEKTILNFKDQPLNLL